jgi:hypothetical protein
MACAGGNRFSFSPELPDKLCSLRTNSTAAGGTFPGAERTRGAEGTEPSGPLGCDTVYFGKKVSKFRMQFLLLSSWVTCFNPTRGMGVCGVVLCLSSEIICDWPIPHLRSRNSCWNIQSFRCYFRCKYTRGWGLWTWMRRRTTTTTTTTITFIMHSCYRRLPVWEILLLQTRSEFS